MKKLSLKNLKLEATDLLQRNQLKTVFGGYCGYIQCSRTSGINPYCCWNFADYALNGTPNYADPSAPGYLTSSERYDLWRYYYDACMGGQYAPCCPVQ